MPYKSIQVIKGRASDPLIRKCADKLPDYSTSKLLYPCFVGVSRMTGILRLVFRLSSKVVII
jgi:hypothetical protein